MAIGLFRTPENWVVVDHGTNWTLMQWDTYRLTGLEPNFDTLPLKADEGVFQPLRPPRPKSRACAVRWGAADTRESVL
jgi:hypothetical protein